MEQDKRKVSVLFMLFGTLFCVCLITANVLETKQLSFGPINLTAGVIVFPVSYIINDVVCEVWGYARTRMLIWMGFAMNFFFVIMGAIADWIPGAPYWHGEFPRHLWIGSPYCCSLVYRLHRRFVYQCLCDVEDEAVVETESRCKEL